MNDLVTFSGLVTFFGGAAIGAFASWYITRHYYVKASADLRAQLKRLSDDLKPRNTLRDFEALLEASSWTKTFVDRTEVWMADADNTFQIERGERTREFTERWTTVYPDPNSQAYPVYLKIGGTIVKQLTFISMDGGRIFVPMPEIRRVGDSAIEYFWNVNSLEVKVCRVIGSYYIYKSLEGVAEVSKVSIVQ